MQDPGVDRASDSRDRRVGRTGTAAGDCRRIRVGGLQKGGPVEMQRGGGWRCRSAKSEAHGLMGHAEGRGWEKERGSPRTWQWVAFSSACLERLSHRRASGGGSWSSQPMESGHGGEVITVHSHCLRRRQQGHISSWPRRSCDTRGRTGARRRTRTRTRTRMQQMLAARSF